MFVCVNDTGDLFQIMPELDLIVWQGDAYREFKPSPPKHRFGVQLDDYVRRNNNSR